MRKRILKNWAIGLNENGIIECLVVDPKNINQLRHLINPTIIKATKPPVKIIREYKQAAKIIAQLK